MLSIMNKLGWFFRQEWKRYTLAVVLLVTAGILEIFPPMLVGHSIDAIAAGSLTWDAIAQTIAKLAVITGTVYFVSYLWGYKLFGGAFVLERILRGRLMHHFLKMTPSFYEKNRTGDLMARSTNDLQAVAQTAGFGILTLLDSTLWMATLLVTMIFFVSWKLTLAAILPLPLMAALVSMYGGWMHKRYMKAQDAFGDMNEGVLETISGIRVIRAYTQERAAERQFSKVTQEVLDRNLAVVRIDSLFEPTIKILVGISYMIGLSYGAYLVFHSELTIGALVSFNVYLGMMIWPMFAIGELINIMQRGNASLDRVQETLDYLPDVPEPVKGDSPAQPGSIVFRQVTFRYPSSAVNNLKKVTFTLEAGKTLGIVGRTGSGKSTLIKQLLREYPAGDGCVELGGGPIEHIEMDTLKAWFGYVPQEPFLFSQTIRHNILFGREQADEEALEEAVHLAAFQKDLPLLPAGLDTLVGEKGVALSGGQKQRVSMARALIADPPILLLDDAMSAVDARTEAEIISNIYKARAGRTTIIATHRLSAVQHADLILVLEDGAIVQQGRHPELIRHQGWYQEQFVRQQLEAKQGEGRTSTL